MPDSSDYVIVCLHYKALDGSWQWVMGKEARQKHEAFGVGKEVRLRMNYKLEYTSGEPHWQWCIAACLTNFQMYSNKLECFDFSYQPNDQLTFEICLTGLCIITHRQL